MRTAYLAPEVGEGPALLDRATLRRRAVAASAGVSAALRGTAASPRAARAGAIARGTITTLRIAKVPSLLVAHSDQAVTTILRVVLADLEDRRLRLRVGIGLEDGVS
jgi:hypothetical protein